MRSISPFRFAIVFLIVTLVRCSAAGVAPQLPALVEPPFIRTWTQVTGDQSEVIATRDGLIYYRSQNGLGALDLVSGQPRWKSLPGHNITDARLWEQSIFALSRSETSSELIQVDIQSHQPHVRARFKYNAHRLAVNSDAVYVLDESATLRAIALNSATLNSATLLWTRALSSTPSARVSLNQLEVVGDAVYAGVDEIGEFGIDTKSGTILWKRKAQYAGLYRPVVVGTDLITQHNTLQRLNVRTGKVLWSHGEGAGDAVLVSNVVISTDDKGLVGRDVSTGRVLWRRPLEDAGTSYSNTDEAPIITDGAAVWLSREPVLCVAKDGQVKWKRREPFTGMPVYADSQHVVTVDDFRILGYVAGTLSPLPTSPTEKRATAERLASQFEILDNAERHQFERLAPYAFPPLLARYMAWAKASDSEESESAYVEDAGSYARYVFLQDTIPLLNATCQKEDTKAITEALSSLSERSTWRSHLEQLLQAKGDPTAYVPTLVQNLRRLPLKARHASTALDAVAHSSHPQAVALMLEALRDPKAAPAWRQEAFRHLAGTGGTQGVEAVRQAKPRRSPQKPWFERIQVSNLNPRQIVSTKKDAQGRTWLLFHSEILGNYSDLFISQKALSQQKTGTGWSRPLFTGAWTERTFRNEAPKSFRGIAIPKLVVSQWIHILPKDASLRKDSDQDGLTDIVEVRLGTNAQKADTDGDKLRDSVDPCPNAAPRPLSDEEKIIAACVEARFFEENWGVPALLSVENLKPFELYGYAPLLLWQTPNAKPNANGTPTSKNMLSQVYGGGVNMIGFHSPEEGGKPAASFIRYSPDGKTARTVISRYSGGLNGDGIEVTLHKINGEWFVTDMKMRYVS